MRRIGNRVLDGQRGPYRRRLCGEEGRVDASISIHRRNLLSRRKRIPRGKLYIGETRVPRGRNQRGNIKYI
jgi:hypothetical protein